MKEGSETRYLVSYHFKGRLGGGEMVHDPPTPGYGARRALAGNGR
jgi:hypothetical protein